ncbi:MAG TPA: hypothetical protein VLJ38_14930 [Polyangiaceae bacterium]|nr:hypothetical protein [Polyangiaceae bacterium]
MQRSCGIERAVGILATLLIGSMASPVAAQTEASEPTPEQVRAAAEAFDLGRQSYKDGRFAEAAEQFERADASAPNATALELAIRARDKAGDLDRAGTLASLALSLYPNDENISKIAPDVIERAGSELYELTVTCSEPCEITDGNKVVHGSAATRRTLFLSAGTHNLRAGFGEGRALSKPVEAMPGSSGVVEFSLEPKDGAEPGVAPVATPEQPLNPDEDRGVQKEHHGVSPLVFWAGVGATGVAGIVTIWSGIDTVNNPGADKVRTECAPHDENCKYYKDGRSAQTRTNVLIGVTSVLGVATAAVGLFAIDWGKSSHPTTEEGRSKPHFTPYVGWANGPALGARGAF